MRKVPTAACKKINQIFEERKREIRICNHSYLAADLSLNEMLDIAQQFEYSEDSSGYFNMIEDYKTEGGNPWEEVYIDNTIPDDEFAVHYDEDDDLTLAWVACEPSDTATCGTAFCKEKINAIHTPERPKPMHSSDLEMIPPETLILVDLSNTAHAPPNLKTMRMFKERIFMTIDYNCAAAALRQQYQQQEAIGGNTSFD